jgi:hypothetical protein
MGGGTSPPTEGEEVCPEIAKTSPIDISLEYSIGKIVCCWWLQGRMGSFSGKNPIPTCSLDAERRS